MRVNYAGHKFSKNQIKNAIESLSTQWLCLGQNGAKFQKQFANRVGRKYGVFVNSGSSANLLAISYLKSNHFRKIYNKEIECIITPVCGFPTTINPIFQNNFQCHFVDINKDTLNINLNDLENILEINDKTNNALIFAHALGNPVDMNKIIDLCNKYNCILIQDCCDALGSKFDNKHLGTFGLLATYSFYPAHHITTGQGGMIVTDDYEVYKTLKSLRDWGRQCYCSGLDSKNFPNGKCNNRFGKWIPGLPDLIVDHKYSYSEMGYNLKPLQLQAVIGLQQLKSLDQFITIRKRNYNLLKNYLQKYNDYIQFVNVHDLSDVSWFAFPITLKTNKFKRSDIINFLQNNGIETRLYFAGNIMYHKMYEKYITNYNDIKNCYPNSHIVSENTFFIGVSQVINEQQIFYICDKFDQFFGK